MNRSFAIGIDIGGTTTTLGLADRRGQILLQATIPTTGFETVELYIKAIEGEVAKFIERAGRDNINGVGVGAPNGNFYTGEIVDAANMPWKGRIPLADMMSKALGYKVTLTNDANATAMGEMMYGAARGMKDIIMVTLGTGVGSGFVANGQLIYGHDGFAGELGHVIAVRDGRPCGCGRKGCMERYCSATGIVITANEWLENRDDASLLRDKQGQITAKDIHEAALAGDKLAIEIFDYTGKILGQTLADAVAITSPQAIILFGGLAKAGDVLYGPVKKYMEENLLSMFKDKIELLPSALPDADAAILGASALAW
ncbi:MAG: ROK family protein [Chitinophagales bacterium]|nr:ROK family protein [Chitinophagales bacterium]